MNCQLCGGPIPEGRLKRKAKFCSARHGSVARNRKFRRSVSENYGLFRGAKSRAKQLGIPFTITLEDIVVPESCPVLGLPLRRHLGENGYRPDSPSLDRKIPELGYVPGNVRVISARANRLKNNATPVEMRAILKDLETIYDCVGHGE